MNISRNLIALRHRENLNQTESAKFIGISRNSLNRIEKGKSKPTMYTISRIMTAYNISFDELTL